MLGQGKPGLKALDTSFSLRIHLAWLPLVHMSSHHSVVTAQLRTALTFLLLICVVLIMQGGVIRMTILHVHVITCACARA